MRFTRIITGTITAGLIGLVPVAVSSPASATVNLTTTTTLELSSGDNPLIYGDTVSLTGGVVGSDGGSAYDGTATLYQYTPSNPTWTPVSTVDASGYLYFSDLKPTSNVAYKVVYSGYAATSAYEDNYAASESVPVNVGVTYKLNARTPGTSIVGKIKPSYAKKKVVIERKVGKTYKKYRTVKTNAKSAFRVKLPTGARGKKVFFRVILKGTSEISPLAAGFYTIRY
jgi:hypothetical protein